LIVEGEGEGCQTRTTTMWRLSDGSTSVGRSLLLLTAERLNDESDGVTDEREEEMVGGADIRA
jgi:hypothetical protein